MKKFIETTSGSFINTNFIVEISDYYGNYWFKMVDGIRYEVQRNKETELLVEYLLNQVENEMIIADLSEEEILEQIKLQKY